MKKNLTTRFVENITVTESRKEYFDTKATGLALRVTRGGTKTWMYQYRIHGRQRKHNIGRYPTWSLAEARKEDGRLQVDIDPGLTPILCWGHESSEWDCNQVRGETPCVWGGLCSHAD